MWSRTLLPSLTIDHLLRVHAHVSSLGRPSCARIASYTSCRRTGTSLGASAPSLTLSPRMATTTTRMSSPILISSFSCLARISMGPPFASVFRLRRQEARTGLPVQLDLAEDLGVLVHLVLDHLGTTGRAPG